MRESADVNGADGERQVKPWRVLHACETVADAVTLAEVESAVGMNPQLLSREYWNPAGAATEVSLLNTWHDVRDWRHALNEAEALKSVQVVHAHSFASAMAGVRGSLPLVYDFAATLEDVANHQSNGNSGPWLLRSFRVAEQFALSRAGAVVAHSQAMKKVANERGAASENIFVVPEPCAVTPASSDQQWANDRGIQSERDFVVFVLPNAHTAERMMQLIGAAATKLENAVFVIESEDVDRERVMELARKMGLAGAIRCVTSTERAQAVSSADVVIAPKTSDSARANRGMLQAMAIGRAVIAADVPENRECSQEGQGCVWYKADDDLDLLQRTTFVSRNREFAHSLGESGREHIAASRAAGVIGKRYDEVYRHVHARRNEGSATKLEMPKIYALGMQML
jgi:glycosyltransferase involved in cell wall biosynthesis